MVNETQAFAAKTHKPFGIDGLDDLRAGGLEASLVHFVLNDKLFVFHELAEMVHFICTESGWEWPGVLGHNEGVGDC